MMFRGIAISLFAAIAAMGASAEVLTPSDSVMLREADAFLKSMPAAVQVSQRDAVRRAAWGDTVPLMAIRESRRPQVVVSEAVDTINLDGGHILFRPKKPLNKSLPLMVYLHGGGWTFGSPASASRFCDALVASGEMMVLDVDYPLSPECSERAQAQWVKSFSSTLRDKAEGWGADPGRIFIGGDSAGGYMALLAAMTSPGIFAGVVPIYPVVRHYPDEDESSRYAIGYANNGDLMEAFYQAWQSCNGDDGAPIPRLATASDTELSHLPKVLMIAAERDVLCRQGEEFAERLKGLGVEVERLEYPGTVHLFITVPGQPAAFSRAAADVVKFVKR